jgi:acid phosphatase class B
MPSSSTSDSNAVTLLISKTHNVDKNIVMLDAQSPIHLVSNAELLSDISETTLPIIVQFTIEDKVRVAQAGFISDIVVNAYYGPHTAANILSCHELQETHHIHYDETQDTFCATPVLVGPALTFNCVNGF